MKKYIVFLLVLQCAYGFAAGTKPEPVNSKISGVTVFLSGAEISRKGSLNLPAGQTELVFSGLEEGILNNSIQASASSNVLILSVKKEVNYLKSQQVPKDVRILEDSLRLLGSKIKGEKNNRTAFDQERDMILANKSLAGEKMNVTVEELRKASDFFRSRLQEIYQKKLESDQRERDFKEDQQRINAQLKEINFRRNRPTNDIVVNVQVKSTRTEAVSIKYIVQNAGWSPRYDIRANDTKGPITLSYHAEIYQNTGVDWEQIKLVLSTGNPTQSGTKPILNTWYLYPYVAVAREEVYVTGSAAYKKASPQAAYRESKADAWDGDEIAEPEPATLADYTQVIENTTTAEFRISIPQNIPSDGKTHQSHIQDFDLPAEYEHYAVPKMDPDAFLTARITDWELLNLMAGPANIYFEGTYLGETSLNPRHTSDTLNVSLGRDKKVVITREQLKEFTDSKVLGTLKEYTYAFEIKVRNTKDATVFLNLEDQIPISQTNEVNVKLIDASEGKVNEDTGQIKWKLQLGSKETKTLRLMYTVKHPKSKPPRGL